MLSCKNYNINANEGFVIFFTSKLITGNSFRSDQFFSGEGCPRLDLTPPKVRRGVLNVCHIRKFVFARVLHPWWLNLPWHDKAWKTWSHTYKMRELDLCRVHTCDLNFTKDLWCPHKFICCEGESTAIYQIAFRIAFAGDGYLRDVTRAPKLV